MSELVPPPPPPPYGGPAPEWPFSPPEAIAWGWRKFTQFLGPVMIGVAIYIAFSVVTNLISTVSGLSAELISPSANRPVPVDLAHIADFAIQLLVGVAAAIGGLLLKSAANRAALDVADGRIYDFVNAVRRIPVWKLIGAQLLIGLVIGIAALVVIMIGVLAGVVLHVPFVILIVLGVVVLILPAIAVSLFVYFTPWVLVDDPTTPITDAIRASVRMVRANLADSLLLALLNVLVSIAGVLACCIGLVVAYPVTVFATANAYRRFQGRSVAA